MAKQNGKDKSKGGSEESLEKALWQTADKLRKNMDAAEYKHIVLGLIFLKYISDTFEEIHAQLVEGKGDFEGANPEDSNEYRALNAFFVSPLIRWSNVSDNAKKVDIRIRRRIDMYPDISNGTV